MLAEVSKHKREGIATELPSFIPSSMLMEGTGRTHHGVSYFITTIKFATRSHSKSIFFHGNMHPQFKSPQLSITRNSSSYD